MHWTALTWISLLSARHRRTRLLRRTRQPRPRLHGWTPLLPRLAHSMYVAAQTCEHAFEVLHWLVSRMRAVFSLCACVHSLDQAGARRESASVASGCRAKLEFLTVASCAARARRDTIEGYPSYARRLLPPLQPLVLLLLLLLVRPPLPRPCCCSHQQECPTPRATHAPPLQPTVPKPRRA
jgi:hypothetical protein